MEPLERVVRDLQYQFLMEINSFKSSSENKARANVYLEAIKTINKHFNTKYKEIGLYKMRFETRKSLSEFVKDLPLRD